MGSYMVCADISDNQMQRREPPEDPKPRDAEDVCGKKRHGYNQEHITKGGEKQGRQQHDKEPDSKSQSLF